MTQVRLDAIGTSTTLVSNKSHWGLAKSLTNPSPGQDQADCLTGPSRQSDGPQQLRVRASATLLGPELFPEYTLKPYSKDRAGPFH